MTYSAIYGLNPAPVARIITLLRSRDKMQKLDLYTGVSGTRSSNYLDAITRLFVCDSLMRQAE